MRIDSSNEKMEKEFDLLRKGIIKVEPSETLFSEIENKISRDKKTTISINWVRTAAAIFICMLSVELYVVSNNKEESVELSNLIPETDNTLY